MDIGERLHFNKNYNHHDLSTNNLIARNSIIDNSKSESKSKSNLHLNNSTASNKTIIDINSSSNKNRNYSNKRFNTMKTSIEEYVSSKGLQSSNTVSDKFNKLHFFLK